MRKPFDISKLNRFLEELGKAAKGPGTVCPLEFYGYHLHRKLTAMGLTTTSCNPWTGTSVARE